jgi:signal transduction histidine kinase
MAETGKPIVISDTQDYEGWEVPSSQPWLRAYIGAPIQIEDETVGYLNVDSAQPHHFTSEDAHRLHVFANYVATTINNARLFHETEQRVAELEALQRVALRLTSTLDLSDVLTAVVESVLASTEAYDCHIFLYEPERKTFTFGAALWRDGRRTSIVEQPRSGGLTAHVVRDGEPIVINDAHQHPFYQTSEAKDWDVHAIAGFPLRWRGHVLGALNVAFLQAHTFTEAELRFLGLLADHAAIAIENAQLHRQVLNHANELETRVEERTQQLQAQYARVEAILNNTSDGFLVTNEMGEILHENPVARRLFNQTLSPEEAKALRKTIQTLVKQRAQRSEQMLELKGLDLQLKVAPILEGGPDGAAVVNIHDITHLNALHRMRAQFISNVSHELRTPTTTIKLYTDLLREAPPEKRERYLDALVTEVKQQAKLVENILHISRIDAGRLDMQPTPTSLSELTARVVARHQVLAQKAELTLAYEPDMQGPTVLLDSDNFELVISNLIRNAIQYTPAGGQVTLTTGKGKHQKRTWGKLTVTDNGIGIPEAELSRIFERFFRGNTPQELQIGGTGLGLAIVKQVVDLHGGHVTVESKVNEGSTFTVWVPLAAK